ncbi:MAG TPA: 5-oxoprolinase subunit PxpB [Candidatus Limnocylindrales bacterium]|nr:5-oxoprolinase subunit PxpB [Candidatus Limnocylindrales bacterium]
MSEGSVRIEPMGESALLVTLGEKIDPGLSARARSLAAAIDADTRLGHAVPAYASVLAPFDPVALSVAEAASIVESVLPGVTAAADAAADAAAGRLVEIPVRYGGPDGPDLDEVAAIHGLAPADVVALHAGVDYTAFFLGFAPGFAYLGPVPAAIATPRLDVPRTRVPAGSVAIGGAQTAVYPTDTPGGWRLIGRTGVSLWDVTRDEPALVRPGDRVRFVPVT